MKLGEKLLQCRQEAGFSQRQLCGDVITRNMLSQIEHGAARPSMDTLQYLANRLGKPVSYFLEEDVVISSNQTLMAQARDAFQEGNYPHTRQLLSQYKAPDPIFDWEWNYLRLSTDLITARQAMTHGKMLYARQLLEDAGKVEHGIPGLERQRLLLLGQIPGADLPEIVSQLPSLEEELLLRAEAALSENKPERAAGLLAAAEDHISPRWNLLQGKALVQMGQYSKAAPCLETAEEIFPKECWPLLETCYRETGDFQKAYLYACKQR